MLQSLKEIGVKGIGTQRILALTNSIASSKTTVNSMESLYAVIRQSREEAFRQVTFDHLQQAADLADNLIARSEQQQIGLIGLFDDRYPAELRRTIRRDRTFSPPLLLWYKGNLTALSKPGLAVIGTRKATAQALTDGEFLTKRFAEIGFNIISGLAIGSDTAAHRGALKAKGKTTAILGDGLDTPHIYPKENQRLAEEILANGGLLLSEYPVGASVNRNYLVARDRLQSGLSKATLIIQPSERGGTKHAERATRVARKPLYQLRDESAGIPSANTSANEDLTLFGFDAPQFIAKHDPLDEICRDIMGM